MKILSHEPVLLKEILGFVPDLEMGRFLDVTAGGGGHFFALLNLKKKWKGECWDRDPLAEERIFNKSKALDLKGRTNFQNKNFGEGADKNNFYDFILADLGVSSFQLDDPTRGMSLYSNIAPDFRMNPKEGESFFEWVQKKSAEELFTIITDFGEEPRAAKIASKIKTWPKEAFDSANILADKISMELGYGSPSKIHPATRTFQAFRIAINEELTEIRSLMRWAPHVLNPGGRLAVISFHSLEDRIIKNTFKNLADSKDFVILTKRPIVPTENEVIMNSRSRSAKLRVLERLKKK